MANCILCDEPVKGKMKLYTGMVNYVVPGGAGITHSCKTPQFFEARSRNAKSKPKAVEQALEKLLLNPGDKKALGVMQEWRSRKLFDLATDPTKGMAALKASEQLLADYVGEPKEGDYLQKASEGLKNVTVHILEPEKPVYKAPYKEPESEAESEPDEVEEVEEYVYKPPPTYLGEVVITSTGSYLVRPGWKLRKTGPYG